MEKTTLFIVTGHRDGRPHLLTKNGSQAEDFYWDSMVTVCHPDDFDTTDGYIDEVNSTEVELLLGRPLSKNEELALSEHGYVYL